MLRAKARGSIGYHWSGLAGWCPSIETCSVCDDEGGEQENPGEPPRVWETIFVRINGNAQYNIGDERFRGFLMDYKRQVEGEGQDLEWFDTNVFMSWQYLAHLYQYTEFILNVRDAATDIQKRICCTRTMTQPQVVSTHPFQELVNL